MRLQHLKTIRPPGKLRENGRFPRITSICWSPNNCKFAISNSDRNIIIYDADGNERDKFATKSGNKEDTMKNYQITAIQFSPDCTKLAIAQTDNIVYIYRLGEDPTQFGEKKSICNKFAVSSAVTAMCWCNKRNDELVFGLASGKLKIGILKINGQRKNKSATLFETNSFVHTIVSNAKGECFYSGHSNKCIYKYTFPDTTANTPAKKSMLAQLSFVANTIQIGLNNADLSDVIVTSINGSIQILNGDNGEIKQHFANTGNDKKLIGCCAMSPSGQNVVFGSFDSFFVLSYNRSSDEWEKGYKYNIDHIGSITGMSWKWDGSKLIIASMIGSIDVYEACLKKYKYSERFSIVYTALNSVVVLDRFSDDKISIKSSLGTEFKKIEIIENRFVIGKTEESLICADMKQSQLLSEIEWHTTDGILDERFNFDIFGIVMIFYSSELFIVELGHNKVLSSCRTEYNSPHLVSLRIMNSRKIIAYLLDLQCICIMDLDRNIEIVSINHDFQIEWIELNEFGSELLFIDKQRCLHLYHINDNTGIKRETLLNFCNYAQWVPESNVVVAQNRNTLCVWYNICDTSQVTMVDICGDAYVQDIERCEDKTVVLVKGEKNTITHYTLNESLITFGTCLDHEEYNEAVTKLERLCSKMNITSNSEIQSMWKQISQIALKNNDYKIARRCFIALGDICKAKYLNDMILNGDGAAHDNHNNAALAILNKQFKKAESIYISNGEIDGAIVIYLKLNKYCDAIKLCKLRKHPLLNEIKEKYFSYLLCTEQHKQAAQVKETDGDYLGAANLYLEQGFAVNALQLIIKHKIPINSNIENELYHVLTEKQNDFENAGLLFECCLNDYQRAFDIYIEGHCYWKAIDLAKKHNAEFGDRVTQIEAKWGHYLYDIAQFNNALHHFVESGEYMYAIECAIKTKQFGKAIEILKGLTINDENTKKISSFYREIGQYYEEMKKYKIAEKLYIKSGFITSAVMMQLNAGNLKRSNELVMNYLPHLNISDLYSEEASKLETQGNIEGAAGILVCANDIDGAILLLKKHNKFNKSIELIRKYKPSELNSAYVLIANQLKNDGDLQNAQVYYLRANEWKSVVTMYEHQSMMDEALSICRKYGGLSAFKDMAFEYGLSLGDDEKACDMLLNYNLYDKCIDYLLNRGMFVRAFDIVDEYGVCDKLDEIHYQYALHLEENGEFRKAEQEFVECNKAKEAIEMYIHRQQWDDAIRVSQTHEPNVIEQVYKAHGIVSMEQNNLCEAEKWYCQANAVDEAIKMYQDRTMYNDAIRLSQQHMPSLLHELRKSNITSNASSELETIINKANLYKENGNYDEAVDILLTLQYPLHSENLNEIISLWEEAVNISMEKALVNLPNTIGYIAKQLLNVAQYEKSAQYYLEINDHKSAINSFLSGKMFEKAKQVCKIYSININEIDEKYNELQSNDDDDNDPLQESQHLFKNGEYIEAMNILNEKGLQKSEDELTFYSDLMNMVLLQINNSETILLSLSQAMDVFSKSTKILHSIVGWLTKTKNENIAAFTELLQLFHLLYIKYKCSENEALSTLYNKQCIALLSYCDWIRCDVLFYDAGNSSQQIKQYQNAFIYYNHFIDITDNVDDPNDEIDYTDFVNCKNISIPHKNIPNKHIINAKRREEIRDWVLEMLATSEINPTLSNKNDNNHAIAKCIVSGASLFEHDTIVKCRSCHQSADKSSWNLYVDYFKHCPWCNQTEAPIY